MDKCNLLFIIELMFILFSARKRRATSHLDQPPDRLDNDAVASAKSSSEAVKAAPLRKSQSGVATLGRLRVVTPVAAPTQTGSLVESPATPEQERPRRRQPSAARSSRSGMRDQSLTQFAVMDDENVSQQVSIYWFVFILETMVAFQIENNM